MALNLYTPGDTAVVLIDHQAGTVGWARSTDGQLTVGRFDVTRGEAPPFHTHTREDEIFMLIKGTALLWAGDDEMAGRDLSTPRPDGFEISKEALGAAADAYGQIVVGPPR
ncbi:hypothetical protein OHR68_30830 [Spirillospora sp. NBC_00431]